MNSKRFLILLGGFILMWSLAGAQQTLNLETKTYKIGLGEKELTLDNAIIGQYRQFYPDYILNIEWKDKKHYTFIEDYSKIMIASATQKGSKELIHLKEINKMYQEANLEPLRYITHIEWLNSNQFYINQSGVLAVIDVKKKQLINMI